MAQYIPGSSVTLSAATKALERLPVPDDSDVLTNVPRICVDYLSHDWEEQDVWASWRSMTRHKNEIANGTRLENASWRTWWKQRNHLKTVSPETLNWLKDSDVTWLYGPLHTAADPIPPPKVATLSDKLGLEPETSLNNKRPMPDRHSSEKTVHTTAKPTKPILKQRTVGEMFRSFSTAHLRDSDNESGHNVPVGGIESDSDAHSINGTQVNNRAAVSLSGRPPLAHTKSDSAATTRRQLAGGRRASPGSAMHFGADSSPDSGSNSGTSLHDAGRTNDGKKHISFNTFVEQCVAYPPEQNGSSRRDMFIDHVGGMRPVDVDMMDEDEYDYAWAQTQSHERDGGYDRDHEDDDYLTFKTKRRGSEIANPPAVVTSSSSSASSSPAVTPLGAGNARSTPNRVEPVPAAEQPLTIRKIAPTVLKSSGNFPSPSPALVCVLPPGVVLDGFGGAKTGPLSPGYVSQGYDDLPIQRSEKQRDRDMLLRGGRTTWRGRSSESRAGGSPHLYTMDEDDLEDDDDAMHIDYFSVQPQSYRYSYGQSPQADYGVGQEYMMGGGSRNSRGRPQAAYYPEAGLGGIVVASTGPQRRHSNGAVSGRGRSNSGSSAQAPVSPRLGSSGKSILRDRPLGSNERHVGRAGTSSPVPPDSDVPRGRSSTRSPPDERDRGGSSAVGIVIPTGPSSGSNSSLSPRITRGRQSASTPSLRHAASGPTATSLRARGPGVTIDTSSTFSIGGARSSGSPTSQSSSHGFPSPVDPTPSPPINIPMSGGLHRSTSGSNVRLLAGEDGLLSRAAGAVSRGFGALWGSPETSITSERR
ncbi:hypothetical protein DACRYDRAFT_21211 [Dacryopinax primogenitus]|uniref:Nitrogen regulatory protein areA GATA-like domain-containing protein n=1 Tax=Dacryopinax primogenitus (strain DJM 731) TaxID=1858805 RepID=M5G510_DACPD|nr:uncharacterized protein DACRYDRAFT_21211 [Dacryopinax primogenitus]EJU03744.1 hypothetical protein DACRYDRAFT_21211 [Dacryopinax primogenitus]